MGTDEQKQAFIDLQPDELTKYVWLPSPNGKDLIKIKVEMFGVLGNMISMAISNRIYEANYGVKDYISAGTSWLPDQLNVIEPIRMFMSWIIPIIKVPTLVALNKKDWPKVMDLVPKSQQNLPSGLQYNEGTSVVAKWVGKTFDISPIKTDYLLTGVLGRSVGYITGQKRAYNPLSGVIRKGYFTSGKTISDYYTMKTRNDVEYKAMNDKIKTYSLEKQAQILKTKDDTKAIAEQLTDYRKLDIEAYPDTAKLLRKLIIDLIKESR